MNQYILLIGFSHLSFDPLINSSKDPCLIMRKERGEVLKAEICRAKTSLKAQVYPKDYGDKCRFQGKLGSCITGMCIVIWKCQYCDILLNE